MAALLSSVASCGKEENRILDENHGSGGSGGDETGGGSGSTTFVEVAAHPDAWDKTKRADVSYQLLVYSFADSDGDGIGDFKGIVDKLDYLDELGVSALWLSPVHPAMSYHGYDVKDYTALNPDYGTEADFKNLIDEAHRHGIKIYMDWVINHTGKDHPWFREALADEQSKYRGYYIFSSDPKADIAAGRIPMIATEGASGYDAGQWFPAVSGAAEALNVKFTLQWGTSPTLTVEKTDTIENTGPEAPDRFLYYGDGINVPFRSQDDGSYTLSLAISSSWGCLVRTSTSSWDDGYKYGAASSANNKLEWGVPMTLLGKNAAADILLPDMEQLMYHSHFWTDWFADLNYGAAATCETSPAFVAICDAAKKWIDLGIDGLRLDGAKHVYHNAASDENHIFWGKMFDELNKYFKSKGRTGNFYMVGEVFDDYAAAKPYLKGLPSIFEFAFWYRLRDGLNDSQGCYFAKDICGYREGYAAVRPDYIISTKLTNHDEDRARTSLKGSVEKAKMAGAVLLTANGSPYIYYGEELGYVGGKGATDEYVRNPMKWGDSYTTTFMTTVDAGMSSVGDAAAQAADEASMLNVYRTFSQLRNTYPALAEGVMTPHPSFDSNTSYRSIAAWYMQTDNQKMLVLHNFSAAAKTIAVDDDLDKAVGVLGSVSAMENDGRTSIKLGAWSSVVYLLK